MASSESSSPALKHLLQAVDDLLAIDPRHAYAEYDRSLALTGLKHARENLTQEMREQAIERSKRKRR